MTQTNGKLFQEPLIYARTGDHAAGPPAEPFVPVARNDIVNHISNETRYDDGNVKYFPNTA
jgi:hypothetical protein